jgi:hypothetical protein
MLENNLRKRCPKKTRFRSSRFLSQTQFFSRRKQRIRNFLRYKYTDRRSEFGNAGIKFFEINTCTNRSNRRRENAQINEEKISEAKSLENASYARKKQTVCSLLRLKQGMLHILNSDRIKAMLIYSNQSRNWLTLHRVLLTAAALLAVCNAYELKRE